MTFATPHVDEHALGIDVGHLEMQCFLHTQSHGVDGPEESVVTRQPNGFEQLACLVDRQHPSTGLTRQLYSIRIMPDLHVRLYNR